MITILRALACGLLLLAVPIAAAGPREPVALIYQISGGAQRIAPDHSLKPLRLYDRLPAGATLELPSGSRATLAFATGRRYELTGPARATLGPEDLASKSGGVKALVSLPPFRLEPIAASDHPGRTPGAILIRGERITGLYPCRGTAALAGATVLLFKPVPGAMEYRIEVQDRQGQTVFQADAQSSPVEVPAGMLHSGRRYWWTVRTLDRPGPVARGDGEFVTLSEDVARAREETWEVLKPEGPGSLPLMAEIDHSLGLLLEARDELRTALDRGPANPALREALAEIEAQLEDVDDRS